MFFAADCCKVFFTVQFNRTEKLELGKTLLALSLSEC
jgi:hypothetical protein